MAKFNQNIKAKYAQYKNLGAMLSITIIVIGVLISLFADGTSSSKTSNKSNGSFAGVIDDTYSDLAVESALTNQQLELSEMKKEIAISKASIDSLTKKVLEKAINNAHINSSNYANKILSKFDDSTATKEKGAAYKPVSQANIPTQNIQYEAIKPKVNHSLNKNHRINSSNYPFYKSQVKLNVRSPDNYVPSGTFVKAVVLGGADADASVNAQKKNNGVMLFKLINNGTLPNNKSSHLKGCFVTASTYGDISSERAYVVLNKISCAQKNRPLIDKKISGWAFFGGKVGIKGQPLMRDGKVVKWAGISGALAGIAGAAQYAQSVQSFSTLGATSVVPGNRIASYSGLGGATKAADQLSSYYIKRAEQYHPVIQVGAGNLVNIVFQDGFSLLNDDEIKLKRVGRELSQNAISKISEESGVPEDVIKRLRDGQSNIELGGQVNLPRQG